MNNLDRVRSYLLFGDGSGDFSSPLYLSGERAPNFSQGFEDYDSTYYGPYNAALIDIGADGVPDIYFGRVIDASSGSPVVIDGAYALNDGHGNFTLVRDQLFGNPGPVSTAMENSNEATATGDIDNDGDLDLLVFWSVNVPVAGSYFQFLRNDGAAGFTDASASIAGQEGGQLLQFAAGTPTFQLTDIDADGDLDIVMKRWTIDFTGESTLIFTNDGTGRFARVEDSAFPASMNFILADMNGDWIPDLVDVAGGDQGPEYAAIRLGEINDAVDRTGWGTDDTIAGGSWNDRLAGLGGNDRLNGNEGDDLLIGGAGDDYLEGGAGTDVAEFSGTVSNYLVTRLPDGSIQFVDRRAGSPDGADILSGIEQARFGDGQQFAIPDIVSRPPWYSSEQDVEVVAATYQFFTDAVPRASGFEYLISSPANPNDLNDPYYALFNIENRYINFASNLGTEGEGAAAFDAKFGALDFEATVKAAYLEIMGKALTGGALAFFLNAEGFYEAVAEQRVVRPGVDLAEATKIVAIGSILNEALKGGTGVYAEAIEALVADVAPDGNSPLLGSDLFAIA